MSATVTKPPVTFAVRVRRILLRWLAFGVGIYLALMIGMICSQRELLYSPRKVAALPAAEVHQPGTLVTDVTIESHDGLPLHGWRFSPQSTETESRWLILYFGGNAGCRADRVHDCCELTHQGCDVVLVDYRGYGDNPGHPTEAGLRADALRLHQVAVRDWMIAPERIVLFGESLGGAVATGLACDLSEAGTPAAALVLNSTFNSLGDAVAWHFPAFPFRYFLWDRYDSQSHLPHADCPVLQFHGTADEIVPIALGQQLFAVAPPPTTNGILARWVEVPGAMHNMISAADMHSELTALFEQLRAPAKPVPTSPIE